MASQKLQSKSASQCNLDSYYMMSSISLVLMGLMMLFTTETSNKIKMCKYSYKWYDNCRKNGKYKFSEKTRWCIRIEIFILVNNNVKHAFLSITPIYI